MNRDLQSVPNGTVKAGYYKAEYCEPEWFEPHPKSTDSSHLQNDQPEFRLPNWSNDMDMNSEINTANGSLAELYNILGEAPLLPIPFAEKGPKIPGWHSKTYSDTQGSAYQKMLGEAIARGGNIGVLLTWELVAIDFDSDELIDQFLSLNPKLKNTLRSKGKRGGQIWIRVEGYKPSRGYIKLKGKHIGEWRCDGFQSVIFGQHPDGMRYQTPVREKPVRLAFEDLVWPEGCVLPGEVVGSRTELEDNEDLDCVELTENIRKAISEFVANAPSAISGNGGHDSTYYVACSLIHGWALSRNDAFGFLQIYNDRCEPAWSDRELIHKIDEAIKTTNHDKPRGHLIPSDKEYEAAKKWCLDLMHPKKDVTGQFTIEVAGDVVGYYPQDIEARIRNGDRKAAKDLFTYTEDVVKKAIRNVKTRQKQRWEKWFKEFRAALTPEHESKEGDSVPHWENPKHLHISGSHTIEFKDTAKKLFRAMAESKEHFIRGGQLVSVTDTGELKIIDAYELRCITERVFDEVLCVNEVKGNLVTKKAHPSKDLCATLLKEEHLNILPKINLIASCPVIYENSNGVPAIHEKGYLGCGGGIFVIGGESVPPASLNEAVRIIESVLCDFRFVTEADKARAIAMIVTPALVQGGFIKDRIPGDFAESDESQSGKGYRGDLTVAVYNDSSILVTQRLGGGTGSFDESFGSALLKGRTFLRLDNLRGKLDSPSLESYFTTPFGSSFLARGFNKSGDVQAGRNILQASSNGLQGTRDISNRMCIVRIRKQPSSYRWKIFHEGDMLDHIRANQGKFLGAVHAVVQEWIRQGKPKSQEGSHSFREWAQILDWILTNIFKRPGMLIGHRDIQTRVSTPIIGVLREMAIEAEKADKLDDGMGATELIRFAENYGVEIPGIKGRDDDQKSRWLGGQLGAAFKSAGGDVLEFDGYRCVRITSSQKRSDGQGYFEQKYYRFELGS